MSEPNLPRFLIIGAAKSGTTALFAYLCQHPDVYRSYLKEPRFFAIEGVLPPDLQGTHWLVDTWERYVELFRPARPDQACGEASNVYLHSAGVIERIHARVPDVRLVVVLRHPVDAVWSHYVMSRRDGNTTEPFERLLEREPLEPLSPPWEHDPATIFRARFYGAHLARWFAEFPRERLLVHLQEDLRADPEGVVRTTLAHIGVDPHVPLDVSQAVNVGTDPRSLRLHAFDDRPGRAGRLVKGTLRHVPGRQAVQDAVNRWNRRPPPTMPAEIRSRLLDLYREDTERLEELLGRDLSTWKR